MALPVRKFVDYTLRKLYTAAFLDSWMMLFTNSVQAWVCASPAGGAAEPWREIAAQSTATGTLLTTCSV